MKKMILSAMIALSMTGAAATPVMAADDARHDNWVPLQSVGWVVNPVQYLYVGLLLPAVQAAREA